MVRKIVGAIFVLVGGALILFLLTYGGPVFPHIIGPSTLAVIGAVLLAIQGKKSTK